MGVVTINTTAPVANQSVAQGASLRITGTASTTGGTITGWQAYLDSVQIFNNGSVGPNLDENTSVIPSGTTIGSHVLHVKAYDSQGASAQKDITLNITAPAPVVTVTVTLPVANQSVTQGSPIHVKASATTTASSITDWQIYLDASLIYDSGTQASMPNLDQSPAIPTTTTVATHTLHIKAYDNTGASSIVDVSIVVTAPGVPLVTRSVASLTAHNVSSAANYNQANYPTLFTGMSNKDGTTFNVDPTLMDDSQNAASPMTISKENLRTLLPSTWAGRLAIHGQFWWGTSSHPNIGFSNTNDADMTNIINDIAARGYDVVIPDWYGATATGAANDAVVDIIATKCAAAGIKFMVMIDQQYWGKMGYTAATYTQGIIDAINHLNTRYFGNAAYEKYTYNGVSRPLLLLWNIAAVGGGNLDWTAIRNAAVAAGNPLLIQYQASGFSVAQSDGSLSWVDTQADNSSGIASGVTYLRNSFLPACAAHQDKICLSSVWKGFNGTLTRNTAWSLGKFIDQQWGQTWLDIWKENSDFISGTGAYASPKRLDYICTVTLDDFEEGSPLQCGIRTNIAVNAGSISGNLLPFTVSGNESTVRQYNLWGTMDGVTATLLASIVPGATKQFDLTKIASGITSGSYTLYVEAQEMPSLQSKIASQNFPGINLPVGTTGVTPPSTPRSGIDYQANINAASAYLVTQQLADGAIQYSSTVINPYFANYGALGWLRDPARYTAVKNYIAWYIAHLQPTDRWGINTGGVIYDFQITNNLTGSTVKETDGVTPHADSVDSYCATFLSLCTEAWKTGDATLRTYIQSIKASMDKVFAALTNALVMDATDGLTWALPSFHNKYCMDNSEVWAGLNEYGYLCGQLADPTTQASCVSAAARVKAGILAMWTGSAFLVNKGGAAINLATFYPDAMAQVFPALCGVITYTDPIAIAAYAGFKTAWPGWPQLSYQQDFPNVLIGYAAFQMTDYTGVNAFIQSLMVKYQPGFPWTWYCMENGWYMMLNSDMLKSLSPVSVPTQPGAPPITPPITPTVLPTPGITSTPATAKKSFQVFEIPLLSTPQSLSVNLGGKSYRFTIKWNDANKSWILDIGDANGKPIAQGIPLVTGSDLLSQYLHLGVGGKLVVQSDTSLNVVPQLGDLGKTGHLYFVMES